MKTKHLTSIIALGSFLPLAAWGGDNASKHSIQREAYEPRPSETRSGSPSARAGDDSHETSDHRASEMRTDGVTTLPPAGSGIERIDSKELEQSTTASDLIGTKVVDREGQDLGKVKDIGLAASPQLAVQTADSPTRDRGRLGNSPRGGSGSASDVSATSSGSESPGLRSTAGPAPMHNPNEDPYLAEQRQRREVERAGTVGSRNDDATVAYRGAESGLDQRSRSTGSGIASDEQPRLLLQPDRSLGLKGDLVAIPANRVHREGDTLRVDLSREELRAIVAQQDSSRVSMNR